MGGVGIVSGAIPELGSRVFSLFTGAAGSTAISASSDWFAFDATLIDSRIVAARTKSLLLIINQLPLNFYRLFEAGSGLGMIIIYISEN
jgi:hypothetical protein